MGIYTKNLDYKLIKPTKQQGLGRFEQVFPKVANNCGSYETPKYDPEQVQQYIQAGAINGRRRQLRFFLTNLSTLARITQNLSFLRDLSGQGDYAFGYEDKFCVIYAEPLSIKLNPSRRNYTRPDIFYT